MVTVVIKFRPISFSINRFNCGKKIGEVRIIRRPLHGSGFLLVAINNFPWVEAKCSKNGTRSGHY